jgi:UDP-N-acetylmuramyl tripeptide synthase
MRFERGGVQVLVDYAHNPEGLRGLLRVAEHLRAGRGRLGLLLGHAGNRQDSELEALAAAAAEFHPALIVVKENEAHLRGRAPGEVPRLIHAALLRGGVARTALQMSMSELEAVHAALAWARPGDVLAMPVHAAAARAAVIGLLTAAPTAPSR